MHGAGVMGDNVNRKQTASQCDVKETSMLSNTVIKCEFVQMGHIYLEACLKQPEWLLVLLALLNSLLSKRNKHKLQLTAVDS